MFLFFNFRIVKFKEIKNMKDRRNRKLSQDKENMNRYLRCQNSFKIQSTYRKVVVLGSANSGKTSFINSFVGNTQDTSQKQFFCQDYIYKGHHLDLDIRDMPPSSSSSCIFENIATADIIMICYDVNKLDSLKYALKLYSMIRQTREDKMPLVLVGTKSDLINPMSEDHVDQSHVCRNIITQMKGAKHVLTSAVHDMNVIRAFEYGLNDIIKTIHTLSMSNQSSQNPYEWEHSKHKENILTSCFRLGF